MDVRTPGEWRRVLTWKGWVVTAAPNDHNPTIDQDVALVFLGHNAQFITAAPDMEAALERCVKWGESFGPDNEPSWLGQSRDALAKAKGEKEGNDG